MRREASIHIAQIAKELDTEFRATCARLDRDEPWFGHFRLRVQGAQRAYRVGAARVPDERIVDWRHPLARAYYEAEPGEEFELDQPGFAKVAGSVEALATLTTASRSVRRLQLRTQDGSFDLAAGDQGFLAPDSELHGPTHVDGLPDVRALLSPSQYRLITSSRHQPVVIQGRAGSGKTSVALYRVAWLTFASDEPSEPPLDPANVLIVMFNKALSSFVRQALAPLKLDAARLDTFHAWALDEIKRSYRGAIEIDTEARPGQSTASVLKKQLGMIAALDAFVTKQQESLLVWLDEKLKPYGGKRWMKRYHELQDPVVRRLVKLRSQALSERSSARGVDAERLTQVHAIFDTSIRRMTQYKEELLKFLCDSELLAEHLPIASARDLKALATFQKSLQTDGASERRPGAKIAFEDLALLLRLIQLKNGGYPDKAREEDIRIYDHLVIDEAQDFGAVELTALLASVRSRSAVTIVGDVNQKIVPDADFIGWDALVNRLGVEGAQVARLEVTHRSTAPIMRVADSIIDENGSSGRDGDAPALHVSATVDAMIEQTAQLARAAYALDSSSHVCIVCKNKSDATRVHEALVAVLSDVEPTVRLGHNRAFEFAPGITVSNARQVKGLEFDTVIVFDPSAANYPSTLEARRALYMVVTRAKERLHFVGLRGVSPLLDVALEKGWLQVARAPSVPVVSFTEEDDEPF